MRDPAIQLLAARGGVAVYIDEHLQFNHMNMEALSNIEALWFEFTNFQSRLMKVWPEFNAIKYII